LGEGFAGKLLDCFYCLSIWIAAPAALFVTRSPVEWAFSWLALSGAACLLERVTKERVTVEDMPATTEGEINDVLRTETVVIAEHDAADGAPDGGQEAGEAGPGSASGERAPRNAGSHRSPSAGFAS